MSLRAQVVSVAGLPALSPPGCHPCLPSQSAIVAGVSGATCRHDNIFSKMGVGLFLNPFEIARKKSFLAWPCVLPPPRRIPTPRTWEGSHRHGQIHSLRNRSVTDSATSDPHCIGGQAPNKTRVLPGGESREGRGNQCCPAQEIHQTSRFFFPVHLELTSHFSFQKAIYFLLFLGPNCSVAHSYTDPMCLKFLGMFLKL